MTLRQISIRFALTLLLLQGMSAVLATIVVMSVERRDVQIAAQRELSHIFREHERELAGNLMLGHKALVSHQLNRIAKRDGIHVGLQSARYTRESPERRARQVRADFAILLADEVYGTLTLARDLNSHRSLKNLGVALGAGQMSLFMLGMLGLHRWTRKCLLRPLEALACVEPGEFSAISKWIPTELQCISEKLTALWKERQKESNERAVVLLARQVAHDIRSPITALEMAARESPAMREDSRMLLDGAITRVRSIADTLLRLDSKSMGVGSASRAEDISAVVIWPLLESVAAEKRCEYRRSFAFKLNVEAGPTALAACASVSKSHLERVLSNLVNNAFEACNGDGQVVIRVDMKEQLAVTVIDNGGGMPEEMVFRLNRDTDVASTKSEGHGLGLRHARSFARQAGGRLHVESSGSGTAVSLYLPQCSPPAWLAGELTIPAGSLVHVLDDDPSIHEVWRVRAAQEGWAKSGIFLNHYYTFDSLPKAPKHVGASVHLVDYDLNSRMRGTDFIDRLASESTSYLVTSKYDDGAVQEECVRLNVKIVPKALAARISVQITPPPSKPMGAEGAKGFTVVVARDTGREMLYCPAQTLDEARIFAQDLLSRDRSASEVVVLDRATNTPIGVVTSDDPHWRKAPEVPLSRMTWH